MTVRGSSGIHRVPILLCALAMAAPAAAQICEVPVIVSGGAKPNVLVAYDTSASMREIADSASVYDPPLVDDLYRANYDTGPDYRAEFEAYLATLDPAVDPLAKHMLDHHGSATTGFDRDAIYDSAENRICDRWDDSPCDDRFSDAAKCNLGMAVTHPWRCDNDSDQGGNQRKTPSDVTTNPEGPFAFGKGYAEANWNNNNGRNMPGISANPPKLVSGGFWSADSFFTGRFLNYLYARGTRDTVARKALADLADFTKESINWCLMAYTPRLTGSNPGAGNLGGVVVSECDGSDSLASAAAFRDALFNYDGDIDLSNNLRNPRDWTENGLVINGFGDTPIARQLRDAYYYFAGELVPPDGTSPLESPIDYVCQESFTIVVTDGRPTGGDYSEADLNLLSIGGNLCSSLEFGDLDDDYAADDLAACIAEHGDVSDVAGQQDMVTYTIGFADDSSDATNLLADTAENGNGDFIFASSSDELRQAFAATAQSILNRTASATSAAVVSSSGAAGDLLVTASFQSGSWQGNLRGYPLPLTDPVDELWAAGDLLEMRAPSDRKVYTVIDADADGRLDDIVELTVANASLLRPYLGVATDDEAEDLIEWTRGHDLPGFRERDPDENGHAWKLGDIVNSDPIVIGAPPHHYPELDYQAFLAAHRNRDKVVYVGANDGGLHAFDAATGRERWMLVPNFNLPRLKELADRNYCHQFVMDGAPTAADIYVSGADGGAAAWRTVLVVGSGRDGAYVALDVTDPGTLASPNAPAPLWQYPNPVSTDPGVSAPDVLGEPDLGWTRAKPSLGFQHVDGTGTFPTSTDRWRMWVGSGRMNADDRAHVFGVSLETGAQVMRWDLDADTDSWATSPSLADLNSDLRTDRLYVATSGGKLHRYRFDHPAAPAQLVFDTGGLPITARPVLSFATDYAGDPETLVLFGTGRLEDEADKVDSTVQRLFVVRDPGQNVTANPTTDPVVTLASLTDNTDGDSGATDLTGGGWYMDLKLDAGREPGSTNPATGFRLLEEPVLLNGVIYSVLFDPTDDPCEFGGLSALLALDLFTGSAPGIPAMDFDGDGDVDDDDRIDGDIPRGKDLGTGMPAKPVVDHERKALIIQSSDTSIETTSILTPGAPVEVRVWKVLR